MRPRMFEIIECRACKSHNLEPHIKQITKVGKRTFYSIDFWYCPSQFCGSVYYFPKLDKITEEG